MECIKKVPAITFDASLLFIENDSVKLDELMEKEASQETAQRNAWEEIVTAPGFLALSFTQECEYPMTLMLHPSTRPGIDWQVSRFDWNGCPIGHKDFFRDKPDDLYKELMDYSRGGITARVLYRD